MIHKFHSWAYIQKKTQKIKINLPANVHNSTIYNHQDMEAT